jgi:acyl-CoA oxidase
MACCLKAVCTADAAAGVEQCRLACGGHGYMACSQFPTTYGLVTASCTYEGENTVLLLQTARYMIKVWNQALGGEKVVPTMSYLESAVKFNNRTTWRPSIDGIIESLQGVAAGKIRVC